MNAGTKHLKNGVKKQYFVCHRTGKFVSTGTGKRRLQSQGSCKSGKVCPATLEVEISKEQVAIVLQKTHYGHDTNPGCLHLQKCERLSVADKLQEGVTFQRILDDVRDNIPDNNLHRIHLLSRKDMWNIERDFGIKHSERLHFNDTVSVSMWVERMNKSPEVSPVLFFKDQGTDCDSSGLQLSDFMLCLQTPFQKEMLQKFGSDRICIDATHGTNGYDFQLTTLMVVDEFNNGVPAAYCISNRVDCDALTVFLNCVKQRVGTVTAKVFMSDDAPAFFNAWSKVMGEPEHRLLCTWHVDRNWQENLSKLPTSSRQTVYQTLRLLLEECDQEKFTMLLEKSCTQLLEVPETKKFGEYFVKNYARRPQVWAYCFRKGLKINTTMFVESYHKILKYVYMDGKKVKRLDKAIFCLLKLTRDKLFERIIKITKGKHTKFADISERHTKAQKIPQADICLQSDTLWVVCSQNQSTFEKPDGLEYKVEKSSETEPCQRCNVKCIDCNICIHTFTCTCVDYLITGNMCKHIHAVALSLNIAKTDLLPLEPMDTSLTNQNEIVETIVDENINTELLNLMENAQNHAALTDSFTTGLNQNNILLGLLTNNYDSLPIHLKTEVDRRICQLIEILKGGNTKTAVTKNEPENR